MAVQEAEQHVRAAVNALPALLAAVETLRKEWDAAREELERIVEMAVGEATTTRLDMIRRAARAALRTPETKEEGES